MIDYHAVLRKYGMKGIREISQGWNRCVSFLAEEKNSDGKVTETVVKLPRAECGWWHDGVHQIKRERHALTRAQGIRGIQTLHGYLDGVQFAEKRIVGLKREYVPGRTLEQDEKIRDYVQKSLLSRTVRELHERGVAHGDLLMGNGALNHGNIIIREDGEPFLVDLGIAEIRSFNPKKFNRAKYEDLEALEQLFS